MNGLDGKIAVVTGGASGIGRAITLGLTKEGVTAIIFDINTEGAEKVVNEVEKMGGQASNEYCDISDYVSVQKAVDNTEKKWGPIDHLVNNAGWDVAVNFLESNPELWEKVIGINLLGPINMQHVVLTKMAERGKGRVVNIASDAGRVGSSGEAVYSACKGGVIALTKTLARELTRRGIRINTVCPGPTDTPLFEEFKSSTPNGPKIAEGLQRAIPMKRLGKPSDYPGIVSFLLSDEADYITGQTISVSGGLTMHG